MSHHNSTRRKYNSRQNSHFSLPRYLYDMLNAKNNRFNNNGRPRKHNSKKNKKSTLRKNAKVFVPMQRK
jgi:hypothetical protein